MSKLTYEQCVALRDAGYSGPDEGVLLGWFKSPYADDFPKDQPPRLKAMGRGTTWSAAHGWIHCPSTDELLEAIQARWPDYEDVALDYSTKNRWWYACIGHQSKDGVDAERQPTPAAALCELYLRLAKETR